MKITEASLLFILAGATNSDGAPPPTCSSIVPGSPTELSEVLGANIGVKVTYDGKIPAINTEEGSYNMMVAENFSNKLIFIGKVKC